MTLPAVLSKTLAVKLPLCEVENKLSSLKRYISHTNRAPKAMSLAVARSILRSGTARTSAAAARFASLPKPRSMPALSPLRNSKQNTLSHRIFRSPVEMSCCVESLLPFHTVTASALLNSMLSVSHHRYGWTLEGEYKIR